MNIVDLWVKNLKKKEKKLEISQSDEKPKSSVFFANPLNYFNQLRIHPPLINPMANFFFSMNEAKFFDFFF